MDQISAVNPHPLKVLHEKKLLLVMVGLPARGKSYIAHKIVTFLNWLGSKARLFNVGSFRRKELKDEPRQSSDFFDATNENAKQTREQLALNVLDSLLHWLKDEGGEVAVFDATNTTDERRRNVLNHCMSTYPNAEHNLDVIFLESYCDDPEVLKQNIKQKIENSPDYKDMTFEEAERDLLQRIRNYEKVYQPINDDSLSYIKLINLQSKVICNHVKGSKGHLIASYLMSIHIANRPIWLTRTGRVDDSSEDLDTSFVHSPSTQKPLGLFSSSKTLIQMMQKAVTLPSQKNKDSHLSESGKKYAKKLGEFINERAKEFGYSPENVAVYTSTLRRALETTEDVPSYARQLSCLNMLDTGVLSGMTLENIRKTMPQGWDEWQKDPFHYRLPGGESYDDLVKRLQPLILDLERLRDPALVVSHISTLQVLYAYFTATPVESCPSLSIPMHTIIQLTPQVAGSGWKEERFSLI